VEHSVTAAATVTSRDAGVKKLGNNIGCYPSSDLTNTSCHTRFQMNHPIKAFPKKVTSQNGCESTNHRIWWDERLFLFVDSRPFWEAALLGTTFLARNLFKVFF